jgi:hypothetical protein
MAEWFKAPVLKSSFERIDPFRSVLFVPILLGFSTLS